MKPREATHLAFLLLSVRRARKETNMDDLKTKLAELDAKIDKAVGRDVKPIHYVMVALLVIGIVSNWIM